MPAVTTAARRAQRVIESDSDSVADELDDNLDEEDEDMDVDDADGDSEHVDSESEPDSPAPTPTIRLRMPPPTRRGRSSAASSAPKASSARGSTRAAAIKASALAVAHAREKEETEEEEELDELEDEEEGGEEDVEVEEDGEGEEEEEEEEAGSRATSPTKMTARQRARLLDTDEHLMALPDGFTTKPKLELTEAERLQKREEMARRRKRQNEQRLQDEQDQTINRLLRAQTGRSRSKLDPADTETPRSGQVSPVKRAVPDAVRWVSRMNGDAVMLRVGVKRGREEWIAMGDGSKPGEGRGGKKEESEMERRCAAKGCVKARKYRCVAKTSIGGCSVPHLKEVEARVGAGEL